MCRPRTLCPWAIPTALKASPYPRFGSRREKNWAIRAEDVPSSADDPTPLSPVQLAALRGNAKYPTFRCPHITDVLGGDLPTYSSPFSPGGELHKYGFGQRFVNDGDKVVTNALMWESNESAGFGPDCSVNDTEGSYSIRWATRAGAREKIFYNPSEVKACVVTCGGLCPGLNNVIRAITLTLHDYGVTSVTGIKYGYRGFFDRAEEDFCPIPLTPKSVRRIHLDGGSFLGSSRGGAEMERIVEVIREEGYNQVYIIGGNGTHAGAAKISELCLEQNLAVSVVGVPKTVDNDILLIDRTFGFDTAVESAQEAIRAAHVEARSARHGVGLVKLMGRDSGFIAMHSALASGLVDVCLIPEIPFIVEGRGGLLAHLDRLISKDGYAVVVVAEGCGQEKMKEIGMAGGTDESGNAKYVDVGLYLKEQIVGHFKEQGKPVDLKYIDPTYTVRAGATNASDSIYCTVLGQNAVHGAFAGYTGITVGLINTHYAYLPIGPVIEKPRRVDPQGRMWNRLRLTLGQPVFAEDENCVD